MSRARSRRARPETGPSGGAAQPPRRRPFPQEPETACLSDGEGQNRTADTTIFSRVLYQLSYLAGVAKASDEEGTDLCQPE